MGGCPWCVCERVERWLSPSWPDARAIEAELVLDALATITREGKLKACAEHYRKYLKDPKP